MPERVAKWEAVGLEERRRFTELYRRYFPILKRRAAKIIRSSGPGFVSIDSRAEEAAQEVMACAWAKLDEFLASPSPDGWLMTTFYYKMKELLRDDWRWNNRLELLTVQQDEGYIDAIAPEISLSGLLSEEDFWIFRKIYLEGYTYQELSRQLGMTKSALAMHVNRTKKDAKKKLEDF